jgi:hypothetical protein
MNAGIRRLREALVAQQQTSMRPICDTSNQLNIQTIAR